MGLAVALAEASKTIKGIRSIYVKDMQAIVDDDRIVEYRITAKISFVLDEDRCRSSDRRCRRAADGAVS